MTRRGYSHVSCFLVPSFFANAGLPAYTACPSTYLPAYLPTHLPLLLCDSRACLPSFKTKQRNPTQHQAKQSRTEQCRAEQSRAKAHVPSCYALLHSHHSALLYLPVTAVALSFAVLLRCGASSATTHSLFEPLLPTHLPTYQSAFPLCSLQAVPNCYRFLFFAPPLLYTLPPLHLSTRACLRACSFACPRDRRQSLPACLLACPPARVTRSPPRFNLNRHARPLHHTPRPFFTTTASHPTLA